jgi:hypothetical protein
MKKRTLFLLAVLAFPIAARALGACADETSSPWCDGLGIVRGKIGPDGKCVRRDATDGFEWADPIVVIPEAGMMIPEAGLDADAATSADATPSDARDQE